MPGPLAGLRVLDLSRVLAGPSCAQILGDLGAEVIKVERPGVGDDTRHWGPPWLTDANGEDTRESSYYLSTNRGKHSITVDITTDPGREIVLALARASDVCVENFKVGALAARGLGVDDLRTANPALIHVSITGFGQTGPRADQPGYDYLAQALGGMMSITGRPDDEPGGGPQRTGVAIADMSSGLFATIAVLAALFHRERTGDGQAVDIALLDCQVAMLMNQALSYLVSGNVPQRTGAWHPSLAPYQPFTTADGQVVIAVGNDRQFAQLCGHLDLNELVDDARFATNPARNEHRAILAGRLQAVLATIPSADLLAALPDLGVPAAAINDIADTFAEPQVQHRGMRIDLPHASAGTAPGIGSPINLSATPVEYTTAPPLLGEHTDTVLERVLGYDAERIAELRATGAI